MRPDINLAEVQILAGGLFPGVAASKAPGNKGGYVMGYLPLGRANPDNLLYVEKEMQPCRLIGMKYMNYRAGDNREAKLEMPFHSFSKDSDYALAMLVSKGSWNQTVRGDEGQLVQVRLSSPGEFIVWGPGLMHTWHAEQDSTMLTLRWERLPPAAPAVPPWQFFARRMHAPNDVDGDGAG